MERKMKIYLLNSVFKSNATGGNILNSILINVFNTLGKNHIIAVTDEFLGIKNNTFEKIISYWKKWKKIAEADVIVAPSSNRRLCFFLNFLRRKNRKITIMVIHHHFAYLTFKKYSIKRLLTKFYEMNILKAADIIVTPGQYAYDMTCRYFEKDKVFFTGVPISKKETESSRHEQGMLVFLGNVIPRKGIHYLIEALGNVTSDYHMLIAGDYSNKKYYSKLISLAKKNGSIKNIEFLGRISDEQKEKLLQKAYVFVFPTLNEGYGIVMLEAMGHGVPVIAFNNSSVPYIVEHKKNGLLVKNRDVNDLAEKISYVLNNSDSVSCMGEYALRTYENAETVDEYKDKIRELYTLIVEISKNKNT